MITDADDFVEKILANFTNLSSAVQCTLDSMDELNFLLEKGVFFKDKISEKHSKAIVESASNLFSLLKEFERLKINNKWEL